MGLHHCISGVAFPVDPDDFGDLAPFVRLAQAENVNHQAFLLCGAEFHEAFEK